MKYKIPHGLRVLQSSSKGVSNLSLLRAKTFSRALIYSAIITFAITAAPDIQAQSCPGIPSGGSESMSVEVTVNGTSTPVTDGMTLPPWSQIRIDSVATAYGSCAGTFWDCDPMPCECAPTGTVYERTVNHTTVDVDLSNGAGTTNYIAGYVYGRNPDTTTAFWNVLDTKLSNNTGPVMFTLFSPGVYQFHIRAVINTTPCNMEPNQTETLHFTVYVGDVDARNSGAPTCAVGEPVNVTNGNMYLEQTDYRLPGMGDGLEVTRSFNSNNLKRLGLFGSGWSTQYDKSINDFSDFLMLNLADGRSVYFKGTTTFVPHSPQNFHGQIVKHTGGYTLTYKDGSVDQFNLAGKLLSHADANGNQTTLTYGSNGKPATITDPYGRVLTLGYDSDQQVISISDAGGVVATYTYNYSYFEYAWVYRLDTVTYADGSKLKMSYEFPNRLITVKDALDNVLESHTYDTEGRALTSEVAGNGTELYTLNYVSTTRTDVTDALGHVTKYFHQNIKGREVVTQIEGLCGCGGSQIKAWAYDNQLNVTSKTDALNHATTYTYNSAGDRLTETDATGTITYTYNPLGQVLTRTDQMGGVTTNTYSAQGNLLTTKDPLNHTTTFTYDGRGQLLTITDPRNKTTTFTYNTNGNLTRRTDALNNQTNIAYDARGRITSVTNALNEVTSYEYDLVGRLKKIIYPDTNFVLFTYDLAGRRTKIKDPRGNETTLAYDAAYRLTSETNAANNVTSYSYDLMSNMTGLTDPLNRTTNYFYDDFHRLTKIKYPEATSGAGRLEENFTYDAVGNLLEKKDRSGKITSFCYDAANRVTTITDPALKVTTYEYNGRSQQTAVVDAINQRYEFVFDALGRVTQEKKGTATKSFAYDGAGNRMQRTDYNSAVTDYTYDELNRLTTISYPDTTSATYGYDVLSRLTTATNSTGTVTIGYDNRGRVNSVTDVFGQVVGYGYDASSNRTQLTLNAATSATYQYDAINRLTQLADSASLSTTFGYDATDKLTSRTLPNGVVTTSQYDGLNRLTRMTHAKSGTTLADFQYQFNSVNSITQMIDGAGTHTYTYDTRDRLTAATHPSQTNESYTLDDVGNRTASHQGSIYSYQAFNRLTSANSNTYAYSANGNLSSKTDASGSWSYTWDYENRLKQVSKSGGVTVTYHYDALGRRIQRTSSAGGTTKFVYDGLDVLQDLDGSGATIADYLNGLGIDNKLRQTVSGTASYFLADQLGTTRSLTDVTGNVTSSLVYDSFGNVTSGTASTRYTYTGRELDVDTGLVYYRARWYDSQHGRFISEDPIGLLGGVNPFGYVANNPLSFADPLGLFPQNPTQEPPPSRDTIIWRAKEKRKACLCEVEKQFEKDFYGAPKAAPLRDALPSGEDLGLAVASGAGSTGLALSRGASILAGVATGGESVLVTVTVITLYKMYKGTKPRMDAQSAAQDAWRKGRRKCFDELEKATAGLEFKPQPHELR